MDPLKHGGVNATVTKDEEIQSIDMMALKVLPDTEASRGDGGFWVFDRNSAQTDISPWELMQILGFSLTVPDGLMKAVAPGTTGPYRDLIMRHFRYEPTKEVV